MKCFSFKELNFKFGIFDNCVDCTYIIHLEENTNRLRNIQNQLQKFKPTKKLFIYLNKGFKNCKKNLYKNQSNYDIIDSYIQIFNHSKQHNFNNILILEDDFIFKRIILQEDLINICNFCNKNNQTDFMLSMGTFPIIYYPINKHFFQSFITFGSHCYIYSKKMRQKLINNYSMINYCGDWDIYKLFVKNKYFYYKPLIYQKFEKTENQSNWPLFLLKNLILKYISILNFDKDTEKAFYLHYKISFILNIIALISILFFLLLVIFIIIYLFAN